MMRTIGTPRRRRAVAAALVCAIGAATPVSAVAQSLDAAEDQIGFLDRIRYPFAVAREWAIDILLGSPDMVAPELRAFHAAMQQDSTAFRTLIAATGFSVEEVILGLGPVPEVILRLSFDRRPTEGERDALADRLDRVGDRLAPLQEEIVRRLAAASAADGLNDGLALTGGEVVAVDATPVVRLGFVPVPVPVSAVPAPAAAESHASN